MPAILIPCARIVESTQVRRVHGHFDKNDFDPCLRSLPYQFTYGFYQVFSGSCFTFATKFGGITRLQQREVARSSKTVDLLCGHSRLGKVPTYQLDFRPDCTPVTHHWEMTHQLELRPVVRR